MTARPPRVFTVPASAPFLDTLVRALAEGRLIDGFPADDDPLSLAGATLYLPTRRACRLARDVFLDVLKTDAAILPRITPIGDIDEDELVFAEYAGGASLALPDAIGGLERKLLLSQLILKWAQSDEAKTEQGAPLVASGPAAALALADDLARLIDDMTTRKVPWDTLDDLVPESMDRYFQQTLRFLKIARDAWPVVLKSYNAVEPAERRDSLIVAEAARLRDAASGPVIAAGSTGSMPATAEFLSAIANLPNGAVVLPGLDTHLDADSWNLIGGKSDKNGRESIPPAPGHPQFSLHGLLQRIGIDRDAVVALAPPSGGRDVFVSEALRPAAATDRWQGALADRDVEALVEDALTGLSIVEAANPEEEALAIAIALREAVGEPEKTAALITPDRGLARRTIAALERWRVPVDDSGGDRLPETSAGIFARLVAAVALGGTEPVPLLTLLKHPLCRFEAHDGALMQDVARLERAILRGPRPRAGTAGLVQALEGFRRERPNLHPREPRASLNDADIDAALALVTKLAAGIGPLEGLNGAKRPLRDLAERHRAAVEALSRDHLGEASALADRDGRVLGELFKDILESDAASVALSPGEYADVFNQLAADRVVRRPGAPGARVRILGPLEARLQTADRVVLAGLNEGTWPPETRSDPWLSRPMRRELGLDLPERRIGLSAHDFAQAFGAREIVLTRAAKVEGAPTVASRFLQRLAAVAGDRWKAVHERGEKYLNWARALDHVAEPVPCRRPAPKPPVAARPTRLTVTEVETWLRDPYSIYARHILKIVPLDDIDTPPGAADRGSLIHDAIGRFNTSLKDGFPADPQSELLRIGRERFAPLMDYPEVRTFWWPRFERIARWYAGYMQERRGTFTTLHAEVAGRRDIPLGERTFTIACRADAIEQRPDGSYAILDYKTGQIPTEKQVRTGLSPQLTLEAAILRGGGFKGIAPAKSRVSELIYIALKGGEPAGSVEPVKFKEGDTDSHSDAAFTSLSGLARRFEDPAQPYLSLTIPMWASRYAEYDHLARVKEWSLVGGETEGGNE